MGSDLLSTACRALTRDFEGKAAAAVEAWNAHWEATAKYDRMDHPDWCKGPRSCIHCQRKSTRQHRIRKCPRCVADKERGLDEVRKHVRRQMQKPRPKPPEPRFSWRPETPASWRTE